MEEVWHTTAPVQAVDRRTRLTRTSGLVRQNVRVWHGRVVRKGDTGPIFDTCFHAHNKQGAAKKCGEAAAKRLNRAIARGESWPEEVGT